MSALGDDLCPTNIRIRENVGLVPSEVAEDFWEGRPIAALLFGLWRKMVLPTCTAKEDPLAQVEFSSKFLVTYQIAWVCAVENFTAEIQKSQWQE